MPRLPSDYERGPRNVGSWVYEEHGLIAPTSLAADGVVASRTTRTTAPGWSGQGMWSAAAMTPLWLSHGQAKAVPLGPHSKASPLRHRAATTGPGASGQRMWSAAAMTPLWLSHEQAKAVPGHRTSMSNGRPSSRYFLCCQGSKVEAVHTSIAARTGPRMVSEAAAAYSPKVGSSPNVREMLAVPYPLDLVGTRYARSYSVVPSENRVVVSYLEQPAVASVGASRGAGLNGTFAVSIL